MPIKPLTAAAIALASVLLVSGPLQARDVSASSVVDSTLVDRLGSPLLGQLPALNPASSLRPLDGCWMTVHRA